MGRKSTYSLDIAREICARMLTLDEHGRVRSIASISEDDDMPSHTAIYKWLLEHEEFAELYARAREGQAHIEADAIIRIADTEPDPHKARVRIDARKWYASKVNAKHYGERLQLDGDMRVKITDDQLESRLAQLLGKAGAYLAAGGKGEEEGPA